MQRVIIPTQIVRVLKAIGQIAQTKGVTAYAVGGCVRDWRLRIVRGVDLDVTVEGDGLDVARAAARALGGTLQLHAQFGTATIYRQATPARIDIATCRRETYSHPAAYPRVRRGTLHEDLFRRDFTMNAMAVDLREARFGTLYDPFHGSRDLRQKVLRVLHPRSFLDDPSRILRGIRFAQRFGFRWDPLTQQLMEDAIQAGALGWLNPGRLAKELSRMADESDPRRCLRQFAVILQQARDHHDEISPARRRSV